MSHNTPMRPIPGVEVPVDTFAKLTHVRDLEYFEGPLLAEFISEQGHTYLFHWVSCDAKAHRWMIYRVTKETVDRYRQLQISLYDLIMSYSEDDFVYFQDRTGGEIFRMSRSLKSEIPDNYLPQGHAMHDPELEPDFES